MSLSYRTHLRRGLAAGLFVTFCLVQAIAATVKLDIPAQSAASALQAFGRQANVEVLFPAAELKNVQSKGVSGDYEPAVALAKLLEDTGYEATPTGPKNFVVKKVVQVKPTTGSIHGTLSKGVAPGDDVRVMIRETGQQARTDRNGEYAFSSVVPGTYLLVATADGYQPLHITDVVVKAGFDLSLSKEELRAGNGTLELQPYVVRAESVFELEKVEVTDTKPKPFSDRNVDLPRGINDVQPYYIFDSKTIDQSGASNVSDFLKQRLTMNTTSLTPDQKASYGYASGPTNTGSINLRGLGTNETLILVDGRRMPNVAFAGSPESVVSTQPDINGIPLSAIDRIEILPASASAIYGGNAVGGVVNIILKKGYVGGEIKATYEVTGDGHAPIRTASISFGQALEGGRTHIFITAQYSDSKPLYTGDRVDLINRGYAELLKNNPSFISGNFTSFGQYGFAPGYGFVPIQGATTNISSFAYFFAPDGSLGFQNLTLKGSGASLNSLVATLPVGYNGDPSTIIAGKWNTTFPNTDQGPNGLRFPLGTFPENRAITASIRRQMTERIEMFADFNYYDNRATSNYNIIRGPARVPASSPFNPFNQDVTVTFPIGSDLPVGNESVSTGFTVGAIVKLPHDWTSELDYTWSQNHFTNFSQSIWFGTSDPITDGVINPFQDNLLHPPSAAALAPYIYTYSFDGKSTVNDLAVRASGPVFHLPWGQPTAVVALEHRKEGYPDQHDNEFLPANTTLGADDVPYANRRQTNFGQSQSDNSAYLEGIIPLVKPNAVPLVNLLELQVAGRYDRYTVSAGTQSLLDYYDQSPPYLYYTGPTLNGKPYSFKTNYGSYNDTVGLRYKPVQDLTFRASYATAFLPPSYSQLLPNPLPNPTKTTITDPKNPGAGNYGVQTISGGNPDLKPQTSESFNAGVIWEPRQQVLKGLRLNLEYYNIVQHNAITSLSPQNFLAQEDLFPGRVTRDPASGLVTMIDTSLINLNEYKTSGWDLSLDYRKDTPWGAFDFYLAGTVIESEQRQVRANTPLLDYVGWTNSGGEAKTKSNATLTWSKSHWTLAWTTRYYSSYYQNGAPGDPTGTNIGPGSYVEAQGSYTIPSQVYHDFFVSYNVGPAVGDGRIKRLLANITLQVGVKNVFNTLPPFDANSSYEPFYYSPYGDIRLRDVWVSARKSF